MIYFRCACGQELSAPDHDAGRFVTCSNCANPITIPGSAGIQPGLAPFNYAGGDGNWAYGAPPLDVAEPGYPRRRQLPAPTSGKALASLILGLVSFCLPVLLSIPAVILGFLGLRDAARGKSGKGSAITGLILGFCTMILGPLALFGLIFPFVQNVREAAASMESKTKLTTIGIGMHNYASLHNSQLPGHAIYSNTTNKPLLSWRVALLPYIGHDALYKQFKLDEPWDSPTNIKLLEKMPDVYAHPADGVAKKGYTYYQVFVGEPGTFPTPIFQKKFNVYNLANMPDGTSNTILVVEASKAVPWTAPEDIPYGPNIPLPKLGVTKSRVNFLFADTMVKTAHPMVNEKSLRPAILADDGLPLDLGMFDRDW
jgi:hypothetical protein